MALINTLRNKMGKFVVVVIAISILSFVGADLLGPNSVLLGGNDTTIGEIAGEEIDNQLYSQKIELLKARYGNLGASQSAFLQNQAWDALISDVAFSPEFSSLGLNVTGDELVDMVQGKNIDPNLRQQFTNPDTGEFDVEFVINYLQQLSQLPPEQQEQWANYERDLRQGRLRIKYDNLLGLSNYITTSEAKNLYEAQTDIAEIKYLYIPFYSVNDSLAPVSDTQLNSYLSSHQDEYKIDESKSISYVNFTIQPSGADSVSFHESMAELKQEFISRTDDSTFARINTDGTQFYNQYSIGQLPSLLQINANTLAEGEVYGPYYENGKYKLYKISQKIEDTLYTAKVRHILIKWADDSDNAKREARQKAQRLLREIKGGADFAELASANSEDAANASQGGDLGWGIQGRTWVPEFEEAVFGKSSAGLVNNIVETNYGFHLIDVVEPKTNESIKIATIEAELTAGQETIDDVYRSADLFAFNSGNIDEFTANAEKENLEVLTGAGIDKNARNAGSLTNARELVRWLFNDATMGEISKVFDLDDSYVVAVLTDEIEGGPAKLENVRNEITIKVRNEIKSEKINSQLAGLSGSLEEIASAYGSDATVGSSSDLRLTTNSLPTVGFAPGVIGRAFSLENGEKSSPIATDNGIVLVELINRTGAPEIADYTTYKNQQIQSQQSRISFNVMEAIKEFADIKDNRYKYY